MTGAGRIGPAPGGNRVLAVFLRLRAISFLLPAVSLAWRLQGVLYRVLLPRLAAGGSCASAVWAFRRGPLHSAALACDAAGPSLNRRPLFGGQQSWQLAWPAVAALRHRNGRRASASALLVSRRIHAHAHAFDSSAARMVVALTPAFAVAGYELVPKGGEYVLVTNRRWRLLPVAA